MTLGEKEVRLLLVARAPIAHLTLRARETRVALKNE